MVEFSCQVCQSRLSVARMPQGQLVRCPQCRSVVSVPDRRPIMEVASSSIPSTPAPPALAPSSFARGGRRFGFNCACCSSRLEADASMSARQGQCPTCGNNIAIPVLDRFGRTIDPDTHQIIKPDPHPVHAYAAAGERAPKILRQGDDRAIQCPRCFAISPIDADNCNRCAMPFTIEGTCARDSGGDNGLCVASLILGVIGLPAMCFVVPSLLAIVFGVAGLIQIDRGGRTTGRGAAIAGIITGAAGLLMFAAFLLR